MTENLNMATDMNIKPPDMNIKLSKKFMRLPNIDIMATEKLIIPPDMDNMASEKFRMLPIIGIIAVEKFRCYYEQSNI